MRALYLVAFFCCVTTSTIGYIYWTGNNASLSVYAPPVYRLQIPNGSLSDVSASPEVLSKTLVVRRAYYDSRKRKGHKSSVVFVLEKKRSVSSSVFKGCQVGSTYSSKVHYRRSMQYEWASANKHVTKDVGFVDCFDIDGVSDGDSAFLRISQLQVGSVKLKEVNIKSQRNLIVPQSRMSLPHPSLVSCIATVRMGEIPPSADGMLYQWLRYQKTIGVDHVHMIAEDTFATKGGLDHPIVENALKENFLSIDFWPRWFNKTEIHHSSQHLAYNDCLYRFQGVYDYVLFSDSDDFFVPCGESKSIKTYLKRWCVGKTASCNFHWRQFYPHHGWSLKSVGPDGNLTATLTSKKSKPSNDYKSAHQIKGIVDVGVHVAKSLMPGYKQTRVPWKEAYFAHLRKYVPRITR